MTKYLTAEDILAMHEKIIQDAFEKDAALRERMAKLGLYHEVINRMKESIDETPSAPWRYGQTLFNILVVHHPAIAERIRGQDFDPFYDNDQVEACITWLEQNTDLGK